MSFLLGNVGYQTGQRVLLNSALPSSEKRRLDRDLHIQLQFLSLVPYSASLPSPTSLPLIHNPMSARTCSFPSFSDYNQNTLSL